MSSPSVINWRILSAIDSMADGTNGYYNPASNYYPAADDAGASGGVATNMSGKHVAFLEGGTASNCFFQTMRGPIESNSTYSVSIAFGVRNTGIFGDSRVELLADGQTIVEPLIVTQSDLNALASGGTATGKFTDVRLMIPTGTSIPVYKNLALKISKIQGAGTYLDFDNIRLEKHETTPYESWQYTNWGSLISSNAASYGDPDGDRLPNIVEYYFGYNPLVQQLRPSFNAANDGLMFTLPLDSSVVSTGLVYEYTFDLLQAWLPAVTSGDGHVVCDKTSTNWSLFFDSTITNAFVKYYSETLVP